MSKKQGHPDVSQTRALVAIGSDDLLRQITSVIAAMPGVGEVRSVSSYKQLESEALDEFGAFIVGDAFSDASPTDVVGLIREHRDESPILIAMTDDPDGVCAVMLERGADECVDLSDDHSMHLLKVTLGKHIELSRIKHENLRLQAALARSLAELKRKNRELEEQTVRLETIASTDLLTSLANRWRLQERMNPMFAEATRYEDDLACLMVDLDDFKNINDTLGHQAGDELLAAVGRIIIEQVRASDIAARIGGDEFVIILPRTTASTAGALAERIRTQFCLHSNTITGNERCCGMSIGIASISLSKPLDAKQLLSHADNALYAAKRSRSHSVMLCTADGVTAQPMNDLKS